MSTLYLVQQGATLRKEQGRFLIDPPGSAPEEERLEVPIQEIERVLVLGNIQLTNAAISSCLDAQIPVVFLSCRGSYKGHLWSAELGDLPAEMAQFHRYTDPIFQLEMAKTLVWGKLVNSKQLLLRANRKRKSDAVEGAIAGLTRDIRSVELVDSLESLRGYEGTAASRYFSAFGQLLTHSNFSFTTRNRRPPTDPVNSMLSFGYTLLFNNVLSLILAEGLNPYLGNLHRSDRKEMHLTSDLVEEFRSPIVDSLVLRLINQQVMKPEDFATSGYNGGVYLTDAARRVFLKNFEARITSQTQHPDVQTQVPYRRAIQLQVQRYKRTLLESIPYEAFLRSA
ncbi:MAG: CRISPR-associated endonuclease Cas1 [Kovacikia sp.]